MEALPLNAALEISVADEGDLAVVRQRIDE
jgi:hypothetical protein